MSSDVVVVGGGIVGSAVAYHSARRGLETLLVDRADEGRATDAGAGIVSPSTSSRRGSEPWFRFAVEAADYYPDLADRLREEQDGPVGYGRPGILAVAPDQAGVAAYEDTLARIRDRQERIGAPAPGTVAEIDPGEAHERFPPLGEVERAFAYRDAARVEGRTFAGALRRAGGEHGLSVAREDVERIETDDGEVTGVRTDAAEHAADAVVVAGGAWSGAFADGLGVDLPIEPHRGQIAHLDVAGPTEEWPIVTAVGSHYLVPWEGGRLAAGATREADAGFDPRATVAGVHEVLDEALRVAPGLADAGLEEVKVGLRPVSADRLPVLGELPDVAGAYLATGHGATGLQLGPFSGRCVAALLDGDDPPADLSAFSPGRFR